MKKSVPVLLLLLSLCFILGACSKTDVSSAASPAVQSSQEERGSSLPEPEPEPASEPDRSSEAPAPSAPEPDSEAYSYYPVMEGIDKLIVGNGYDQGTEFIPSDEERETLWGFLRIDEWEVATDLPAMGFAAEFYLEEGEQTWFFNRFSDTQTLIVPSFPDQDGTKICYFAPADVTADVLSYSETLTPVDG